MEAITKPLYESPKKEVNTKVHGTLDTDQCVCCMKPIKNSGLGFWVHMNTAWEAVNPDIEDVDFVAKTGHESQGWFQVGPDCAKKMKGFTFRA